MLKTYSLQELATQIGATVRGNADVVVENIAPLDKAQCHQLTFISNGSLFFSSEAFFSPQAVNNIIKTNNDNNDKILNFFIFFLLNFYYFTFMTYIIVL